MNAYKTYHVIFRSIYNDTYRVEKFEAMSEIDALCKFIRHRGDLYFVIHIRAENPNLKSPSI